MKKTILCAAVALFVLAADQLTKFAAVVGLTRALEGKTGLERVWAFLRPDGPVRARGEVRVLEDFFHLRYVENPGAAWGLFADLPDGVRGPFFVLITLVAVAFVIWMIRKAEPEQRLLHLSLALVLGGALGNFVDRLMRGYVVDFLDFHWRNQPGMRWPTFNVADVAISVGVALLLFDALLQTLRARRVGPQAAVAPEGQASAPVGDREPGSTEPLRNAD